MVFNTLLHLVWVVLTFLPKLLIQYVLSPVGSYVVTKMTHWAFSTQIVFNCAWEDPRVDLQVLNLEKDKDSICIITSAGCNVLSLALSSPQHIYSIDANPCQNALLELKIAAIREFEYETFWEMFGKGRLESFSSLWYPRLRQHLSKEARAFWDSHSHYFDGKAWFGRNSFYYRGCGGFLAWVVIKGYFRLFPGLNQAFNDLIHAGSIEKQKEIYHARIEKRLWNPFLMWVLGSPTALAVLNGVPQSQQKLLAEDSGCATIVDFIKESLETVMIRLPLSDNYFWRVYLEDGSYSKDCCPDYLVEENFQKLKEGLVDRISIHTEFIEQFLVKHKNEDGTPKKDISRYILLDHMDWMTEMPKLLSSEWDAILDHSTSDCRYLWRSASVKAEFVGETKVKVGKGEKKLKDVLEYHKEKPMELHQVDRVHTYASFYVADLK